MTEPAQPTDPSNRQARRVATTALVAGLMLMGMKFGVFWLTGSAAVMTDTLESSINIIAAGIMWYALWLSGQPADRDHPYGHGKVEFMTLGLEGGMILAAGLFMGYISIHRLIHPVTLQRLDLGTWLLLGVNIFSAALAGYIHQQGRRLDSPVLLADAKHLFTDVISTFGVLVGLTLVRITGLPWIDPLLALILAGLIFYTGWRLLCQSTNGLMDRIDQRDQAAIEALLEEEKQTGRIKGYHKVRHRHTGPFHWVDMHLQVDGNMTVRESHDLASRIEYRIEQQLGQAKATAHIEPESKISNQTDSPNP